MARDTSPQIPCFDRCQYTIICMSFTKNIRCKPRLHDYISWNMIVMLSDVVVFFRCRRIGPPLPRLKPLFLVGAKGSVNMVMVLRLVSLRVAGAPVQLC